MDQLSVLVVGTADDAARSACAAAIADLSALARVEHAADLRAAAARLADAGSTVELVAIAEPRPGHYTTDQIDALRRIAPLARVWRLLGSWCEGEQRSGQPPIACSGTYWHRLRARLSGEFDALRRGRCASWSLPLTATPDELLSAAAALPIPSRSGLVVVCASRAESGGALADACRMGGYETKLAADGDDVLATGAVALLWDTSMEQAVDARRVERLRRAAGGAPVLAVAGFPRDHEVRRAIAAGVADVVSKPYLVRDLLWHVARAVESHC